MIEDSLPYLVNYFGCINGSRNVYMNFALFFAYGACWYVKNGIKSFEAVFCHHLLTYILLFSVPLLHKDWRLKKLTTFAFGQFATISGHFLAKYINIFHKT